MLQHIFSSFFLYLTSIHCFALRKCDSTTVRKIKKNRLLSDPFFRCILLFLLFLLFFPLTLHFMYWNYTALCCVCGGTYLFDLPFLCMWFPLHWRCYLRRLCLRDFSYFGFQMVFSILFLFICCCVWWVVLCASMSNPVCEMWYFFFFSFYYNTASVYIYVYLYLSEKAHYTSILAVLKVANNNDFGFTHNLYSYRQRQSGAKKEQRKTKSRLWM